MQAHANADDVADGIDRADFVEMDLFDTDAVGGGFGFSERLKNASSGDFNGIGQIGGSDHFQDSAEVSMLGSFGDSDAEFGGGHATAFHLVPGKLAFGCERLEGSGDSFAVGSGVGKRSD